ncbi:AraC family transcriptional regulator [Branchiibius hedensis]|uniref:AraC family transcriptional regulator n=1 Tax=Branchiibius hedensis TaxID=672460 RepID=UPI001473E824|nr:AraC family transcriptional regulator [Branchiibius hedensis]
MIQARGVSVASGVQDAEELVDILTPLTRPHRVVPVQATAVLDARVESVVAANISLSHVSYGADVIVTPADVDVETFLFPVSLSGSARLTYGDDTLIAKSQTATVIAPYRVFRSEIRADHEQIIVTIPRSRLEILAARLLGRGREEVEPALANVRVPASVIAQVETVVLMATEDLNAQSRDVLLRLEDLLIESILLALPDFRRQLPSAAFVPSRKVGAAMAYMDDHLAEPLTISEVATQVGVTARGLQLAFQRELNQTPMRWLRDRRLDAAHGLLSRAVPGQEVTVTSVARATGLHHLGHFARAFRDRFGEQPSSILTAQTGRLAAAIEEGPGGRPVTVLPRYREGLVPEQIAAPGS